MDSKTISVQSLQRAFLLVEILARHPAGLTLGELTLRSRLHKSTTHRLLGNLIALGYVRNRGVYMLTPRLFELGCHVMEGRPGAEAARPLLRDLSARTGETAFLSVREGDEGLCVHKVESPTSNARAFSLGQRFPLYCTAMGKSMLAALPEQEVRAVWERLSVSAHTPRTITRIGELLTDLRRVRAQGYAVSYGEYFPGVASVGCALPSADAAFSVCCPIGRLSAAKLAEMSAAVKAAREAFAALSHPL
ncbi:MAG: IclR family transcriptional regulator [Oscillospiraceae bacterium]|nr:IclR family transcriptional regulator [Oscillospiraceae bacterium]